MIPPVSWTWRAEGEYPPPVISLCLTKTDTWNRQGTISFFNFFSFSFLGWDFQKCIKHQAIKYRPGGVKSAATLQAPRPVWLVRWAEDKDEESNKRREKAKKVSIMQRTLYTVDRKMGNTPPERGGGRCEFWTESFVCKSQNTNSLVKWCDVIVGRSNGSVHRLQRGHTCRDVSTDFCPIILAMFCDEQTSLIMYVTLMLCCKNKRGEEVWNQKVLFYSLFI